MQTAEPISKSSIGNIAGHERRKSDAAPTLQTVATGETLFGPGDERRLYRVESGAICHFIRWRDGRHDVFEFAFPGDIIGLGNLSTHVSNARAMVDTVVSVIDDIELERELVVDHRLALRASMAGEREFDFLRDQALNAGRRPPVARVACYLVAISNMKLQEGREPALISNEVSSGYVAGMLHIDIDTLAQSLVTLQSKGLVTATDNGLCILDIAALEKFAEAA